MIGKPAKRSHGGFDCAALPIGEAPEELAITANQIGNAPMAEVQVPPIGVCEGNQVLIWCVRHAPT